MAAARWPPRSDPQNNQDFRPRSWATAQPALGGIVRHADAAVFEEQREGRPAAEHVLDRLHKVVPTRQLRRLLAHIGQARLLDQCPALRSADGQALLGALAIDRALDLEQSVDAAHDLDRYRRERYLGPPAGLAARVLLDVGEHEELAPRMRPARRLPDRAGLRSAR